MANIYNFDEFVNESFIGDIGSKLKNLTWSKVKNYLQKVMQKAQEKGLTPDWGELNATANNLLSDKNFVDKYQPMVAELDDSIINKLNKTVGSFPTATMESNRYIDYHSIISLVTSIGAFASIFGTFIAELIDSLSADFGVTTGASGIMLIISGIFLSLIVINGIVRIIRER